MLLQIAALMIACTALVAALIYALIDATPLWGGLGGLVIGYAFLQILLIEIRSLSAHSLRARARRHA